MGFQIWVAFAVIGILGCGRKAHKNEARNRLIAPQLWQGFIYQPSV